MEYQMDSQPTEKESALSNYPCRWDELSDIFHKRLSLSQTRIMAAEVTSLLLFGHMIFGCIRGLLSMYTEDFPILESPNGLLNLIQLSLAEKEIQNP